MTNSWLGEWTNADSNTRDITQLIVTLRADRVFAHGYGACTPKDCDWGEVSLNICEMPNDQTQSRAIAIWTRDFKNRIMTLHLEGDALIAESYNVYKDNSRRPNRLSREILIRRISPTTAVDNRQS
jgi:eukaryotic-like serine/threonine-protein kinase